MEHINGEYAPSDEENILSYQQWKGSEKMEMQSSAAYAFVNLQSRLKDFLIHEKQCPAVGFFRERQPYGPTRGTVRPLNA